MLATSPLDAPASRRCRVGIVEGEVRVDLDYDEDSTAEVDLNVVATGDGELVEVQGTAEGKPFPRDQISTGWSTRRSTAIARLKERRSRRSGRRGLSA